MGSICSKNQQDIGSLSIRARSNGKLKVVSALCCVVLCCVVLCCVVLCCVVLCCVVLCCVVLTCLHMDQSKTTKNTQNNAIFYYYLCGNQNTVLAIRQSQWIMFCSALITPTLAMAEGLCSRPQTWARNFPAIFWLIVMSWRAVLSNCGRFSWLRSEQCFLSPVGLGGNWYILLQPRKKSLSKPWCNGVTCHHQLHHEPNGVVMHNM